MGFAEFVLHLSRMNPDMMYLHEDCGYINIAYFKFDIDDQTGNILLRSRIHHKSSVNYDLTLYHTTTTFDALEEKAF